MPGMQADRLNRPLDRFRDVAVSGVQRFAGAGEFEQGIDEVGHQVHAGPNFLIQLLALRRREVTVAQEFGVGDDGGEGVAQIVRNRTGHASDGGQLFGLQQVALALEKAGAHAVEGASQFGDFVSAARIQRMMEVAAFQGAHAGDQTAERPGESVRDEEHQSAADQDRGQAQQKEIAIQLIDKLRGLIVGAEDAQTNRRGSRARQDQRSGEEAFAADLDIARIVMDRPCDQILNASALHLRRSQRGAHDFVSAGKGDLAAGHFADFRSQAVVDLVPNDEEPEQSSVRPGAAIDGLDKRLVEVMLSQPPVAGFSAILIEGLLEIFFGRLPSESGSLGMQRDDSTAAIDHAQRDRWPRSAKCPATHPGW